MSNRTLQMTDRLYDYLLAVSTREHPLLERLREETALMPGAGMQIAPEQGQLMAFLVKLTGARKAIEVGVFTGYSSLAVALAMPPEGRLVACDVNEATTAVARRYWQEAGVADRITLRLDAATETLEALLRDGQRGSFDFVFIDADKVNYGRYYDLALALVRPGGLIAIDNVLWGGSVVDPADRDEDTVAIRTLNERLHGDERIDLTVLPIGDGLTLARKRA